MSFCVSKKIASDKHTQSISNSFQSQFVFWNLSQNLWSLLHLMNTQNQFHILSKINGNSHEFVLWLSQKNSKAIFSRKSIVDFQAIFHRQPSQVVHKTSKFSLHKLWHVLTREFCQQLLNIFLKFSPKYFSLTVKITMTFPGLFDRYFCKLGIDHNIFRFTVHFSNQDFVAFAENFMFVINWKSMFADWSHHRIFFSRMLQSEAVSQFVYSHRKQIVFLLSRVSLVNWENFLNQNISTDRRTSGVKSMCKRSTYLSIQFIRAVDICPVTSVKNCNLYFTVLTGFDYCNVKSQTVCHVSKTASICLCDRISPKSGQKFVMEYFSVLVGYR